MKVIPETRVRTKLDIYVCFYYDHQVDTSSGGLLAPASITRPVVSVTITGSIPLLVDY